MMADLVLKIKQGLIRGQEKKDVDGNSYTSFLGIPFGKPPVGPLRFKDPQPADSWTGTRDGTIEGNWCYSYQMVPDPSSTMGITMAPVGSEDCLFLNVYTPKVKNHDDSLRPVMVFVHGGGFFTGSASPQTYSPNLLLTQNVVLVTVQYRLGMFGFLSLVDQNVGNAGLKDIVLSLKWVQENIKEFGGNCRNVTLFGESAGSAAAHYLVLSPQAKGLFHRVICQSGVATNIWARGTENNALKLTKYTECNETDPEKLLKYLQGLTKEEILKIQLSEGDVAPNAPKLYSPTIEDDSPNAIITKEPIELIATNNYNHVPIIFGMNSEEGLVIPLFKQLGFFENFKTDLVPYFAGYKKGTVEYDVVNKKIANYYFGSDTPNSDLLKDIKLASDLLFMRGINSIVKDHSETWSAPIYYYVFSYDTKLNMCKVLMNGAVAGLKGTSHGDDLGYVFQNEFSAPLFPLEKGSVEDLAWRKVVKLWTNFAKTGNPTPDKDPEFGNTTWKTVKEPNTLTYLDINEVLKVEKNPFPKSNEFWDEILKNAPGY